jgi:hypothetical protein
VHERVDLDALVLGRVLSGGEVVSLEGRLLCGVDGLGGLSEHRDDDEHHHAEDDRVHRVEHREEGNRGASGGQQSDEAVEGRHDDRVCRRDRGGHRDDRTRGRDRADVVQPRRLAVERRRIHDEERPRDEGDDVQHRERECCTAHRDLRDARDREGDERAVQHRHERSTRARRKCR